MERSPKRARYVLLILGVAIGVWLSLPQFSARRPPGPSVKTSVPEARPTSNAKRAPVQRPHPPVPGISTVSAALPLWASAIGMDGQTLEPLSTTYSSTPRNLQPAGRIAYFDANALASLTRLHQGEEVTLPLMGNDRRTGLVNLVQIEPAGVVRVGGSLTGTPNGSFSLTSAAGQIAGRILVPDQRLAYEVTTPRRGQMVMHEVDLADVICYRIPRAPAEPRAAGTVRPQATAPVLSSRPAATAVLYLDFDGATVTDPDWNYGNTIVAAPSPLTSDEVTEVWNRVKENYWPFNVDVTTDPTRYSNAPVGHRMRVIITPTDTADPGMGGVAMEDSFSQAGTNGFRSDIPCWVFNNDVSSIAMAVSHELGHTLGLHHDGLTSPATEYYAGQNGWGPLMGAPYYQSVVQWCKGEYQYANNFEDQVSIIANAQTNGFGYINDPVGNTRSAATPLNLSGTLFSQSGTIISAGDSDYYVFTADTSKSVTIDVEPATYSPDLDVYLELQDSGGNVLVTVNPTWSMNATLMDYPIFAGTYYIKICGTGRGNPLTDGYSNYGSIGYYSLSGSIIDGPGPVAPTISSQPRGSNVSFGDTAYFEVFADGTNPLAFQWSKDGVNLVDGGRISGSTTNSLSITQAQSTDAGSYTVIVRNAQGSVTSNAAALTVSLIPPPVFYSQPSDTTVIQSNSFDLTVYASGSGTITYQWYKDGQLLPGATYSYLPIANVTFSDAGSYQVTATNAAGTTWSNAASVTVIAGTPPTIVTQPQSQDLYAGQSSQLGVYATSNAAVTYQWFRNGTAIAGATSFTYYIWSASSSDSGIYTVVASTAAGSATSAAAFVTVKMNLPPVVTIQSSTDSYAQGNPASFSAIAAAGTPPLTYQWYHNGSAIAGATTWYFSISSLTAADAGEYYLTVTNPNGATTSNTVDLTFSPSGQPAFYWLDAKQVDGVVYLLQTIPLEIARYDLASSAWLTPWTLTQTPTAFDFASDAIYVAYGADVVRYDRTFGGATALCTAPQSIGSLVIAGNYVLTFGANNFPYAYIDSYDRTAGTKIAETSLIYSLAQGFSYCASASCVFGMSVETSPTMVYQLPVRPDGTLGTATSCAYANEFLGGARTTVLGDDAHVTDDDGIVYHASDLTYAGSFGTQVADVVSAAGPGFYTLSGSMLHAHDDQYRQTASARISVWASRLFRWGSTLYAFSQPTSLGSVPTVQSLDVADFQSPVQAPALNARGRPFVPSSLLLDENGVLYVSSGADRNIFRWSAYGRRYLRPIPLTGTPTWTAYSSTNRALYFAGDGSTQLRSVALNTEPFSECPFYSNPQWRFSALQSAGSNLFVIDGTDGWGNKEVLSSEGTLRSRTYWGFQANSPSYTWNAKNLRLYSLADSVGIRYDTIASDGTIVDSGSTQWPGQWAVNPPVRVSPDGTVALLGSGQLCDAVGMTSLGTLPTTNVTDAAWTQGTLHLLHANSTGAEVQSISNATYQIERSASFPGKPLALFARSDERLLLVTSTLDCYLQYYLLSAGDLSVISHDDTSLPTVYHDFDGDGHEDLAWHDPATGEVTLWLMTGTGVANSITVGTMSAAWRLAATGDVNGDGQPDLVWQNLQTGEFGYWAMKGTINTSFVSLGTAAANTRLVGLADFNDDGQPDIVWQNTVTGDCSVSLMNGATVGTSVSLGNIGTNALVVGLGDFNGDGNPDLIVQNTTTGEYTIRLMQQTTMGNSVSLGTRSSDWQLAATGAFNGNGAVDLVWENSQTRACEMWLMNGTSSSSTVALPPARANDQAFLQLLFAAVLGRPADAGGLANFESFLAGGGSRADAFGALVGSTEYGSRQVDSAIRLYYAALARIPDYAGLQNWSTALHNGTLTLTQAADQFAGSAEFTLKYGSLDNTGYVQQLYRNVLDREADPAGLADWVGQLTAGRSRGTVLLGFSESDEFKANLASQVEIVRLFFLLKRQTPTSAQLENWLEFLKGYDQTDTLYAIGYPSGLDDAAYIRTVFRGFLRRDPDTGALSAFGNALAGGAVTHAALVDILMNSDEFSQNVAPVARLYLSALLRVPDAPGFDNWVSFVREGNSLQSTADLFAASQEFTNRYGAMNDTQYVTALYENILGREPDPEGLADWTGRLANGTGTRSQILIGFAQSQEAMKLFQPTLRTFLHYFAFMNTPPTQADIEYWRNYLATMVGQMRESFLNDPVFTSGG
jgi:Domain of unknown function (DUF4214)/Immunoglobulin I-set domain/Immunoglobulin domain/FG-GAP-like repeat